MFDRLLGVHVGWILISPLDNPSFGESTQDKSSPSQLKKQENGSSLLKHGFRFRWIIRLRFDWATPNKSVLEKQYATGLVGFTTCLFLLCQAGAVDLFFVGAVSYGMKGAKQRMNYII